MSETGRADVISEIKLKSHGRRPEIDEYRKENLKKMTGAHKKAYQIVKQVAWKTFDYDVKTEKVFTPYLLDIFIEDIRVGIEIDGGIHSRQVTYDETRDAYLYDRHGIKVYRFKNEEVKSQYFRQAVWALCYSGLIEHIVSINRKASEMGIMIPEEFQSIAKTKQL